MLKILENYEDVTMEYSLNGVRVTKKLKDITEQDIATAKKCGVHLAKYFEKTVEPTEEQTELPTIAYEGVEVKPKRKRK
jgi:hypothetical protein